MVISAHAKGEAPVVATRRIGTPLIFERLWRETGCQEVVESVLAERRFEFPVERTIFLEILHRLVHPGSDRSCYGWKDAYLVPGAEDLDLHHAYRAMAWLGEELAAGDQEGRTPFTPVAPRTSSRRSCSVDAGTCSRISSWCSSTRRPCTSRARVVMSWVDGGTARTIAPTSSRWWWE